MEFHQAFQENGFEPEEFSTEDAAGMFVGSMAFFSGFQLETLNATVVDILTGQTGDEQRAMELLEDLNWGDDPGSPTSTVQSDAGYTPPYAEVGRDNPTSSSPAVRPASASRQATASPVGTSPSPTTHRPSTSPRWSGSGRSRPA